MPDSKEKILKVSKGLFQKYGIRSVTMDDIAQKLAMSKKTIYQYFKDKSEIVYSVVDNLILEHVEDVESIENQSLDSIDAILTLSKYIQNFYEQTNPAMIYDVRKHYPKTWDLIRKYRDRMQNTIKRNIRKGIDNGLYRDDLNISVMATLRIEMAFLTDNEELFPPEQYDLLEVDLQLLEHFVRGLVTKEGFEKLEKYKNEFKKIAIRA